MENLYNILESILFVSGDGIAIADIAEKLEISEEEVLEKLSLLTLCHEIQHYIQDKQNRLGEPLEHLRTEELELEAESIGSKCLLNFKQHGNLNGIKDLLAI